MKRKILSAIAGASAMLVAFAGCSAKSEVSAAANANFENEVKLLREENEKLKEKIAVMEEAIAKVRETSLQEEKDLSISEEYAARREVLAWYTSLATIRTRSADTVPAYIVVDLALGYKRDDNVASTEITSRLVELNDFLRRYFAQKTYAELQPYYAERLRVEIKDAINGKFLKSSRIHDVAFRQFDVVQQ